MKFKCRILSSGLVFARRLPSGNFLKLLFTGYGILGRCMLVFMPELFVIYLDHSVFKMYCALS